MAKIVIVHRDRCLGCKSCELACAMAHCQVESLVEAIHGESRPQSRMHVEPGCGYGIPMHCMHCEDAPCMAVCPTEAISRTSKDSPVLMDQERCIGCRFCLLACPFGAIDVSREGKAMIKCDMCIERTEAGELPACVSACPTGALKFQEIDAWLKNRRRQAAELLRASDR